MAVHCTKSCGHKRSRQQGERDMGLFEKIKEPVFLKRDSSADEQLAALQALRETVPPALQEQIDRDIRALQAGIAGEKNILFELENSHLPMFVLRDLNLEFDGKKAQIDFLLITRRRNYVVECKNLYGNIEIGSGGDFVRTLSYGGRFQKEGIYSPITQNQRHLDLIFELRRAEKSNVLIRSLFEKNFSENYRSVIVLANPKTVLNTRYAKREVREIVIRADQLADYIRRSNAQSNLSSASNKEMEALARFFLAQHHPASADFTAKYRQQQGESAEPQADPPPSSAAHSPQLLCPRCGAPMVRRRATRGPNAGKEFYGCTNYPRCRGIVNIDQ